MILIPLVENSKTDFFETEKGLSLFIKAYDKNIVFDLGKTDIFVNNAKKLNIDLATIDFFVISHGHKDHSGGTIFLEQDTILSSLFLEKNSLNNDFFFNFYGIRTPIGKISLPISGLAFDSKLKLADNIYLVKSFKREKTNFYLKNNHLDNFDNEIHLIIIENDKLNIVTGCCHCGIINLIETLTLLFPNKNINSIIGGLHTRTYFFRPIKLIKLIYHLKKYNISKLLLGHCTGKITQKILSVFLKNLQSIKVGETYSF